MPESGIVYCSHHATKANPTSQQPRPLTRPTLLSNLFSSAADQLLVSMVHFLVRLADQPAFVAAVSAVRGGGGAAAESGLQ